MRRWPWWPVVPLRPLSLPRPPLRIFSRPRTPLRPLSQTCAEMLALTRPKEASPGQVSLHRFESEGVATSGKGPARSP